jgi:hypothetical protein
MALTGNDGRPVEAPPSEEPPVTPVAQTADPAPATAPAVSGAPEEAAATCPTCGGPIPKAL